MISGFGVFFINMVNVVFFLQKKESFFFIKGGSFHEIHQFVGFHHLNLQ